VELDGQRGGLLLAETPFADGIAGDTNLEGWLRGALEDPDRLVCVGHLDEVPLGFALAHIERRRRPALAVVDMLHVVGPAREVGVGEAILNVVLDWAERRHAGGIDAPALPGNRSAKAFFETHGFTARLLTMHRTLEAISPP
jgi:GNAT superfamily N-acetyltransferase